MLCVTRFGEFAAGFSDRGLEAGQVAGCYTGGMQRLTAQTRGRIVGWSMLALALGLATALFGPTVLAWSGYAS